MKKIIGLFSFLLISSFAFGQGIDFKKESYAELLKQAKKENKAIFIDVYTSWCGPCKHMSEQIFPLQAVGEKYNQNFICVKLDAEKSEDGKLVAKKFGVNAYPTLLFVNGDGELVYRFLGGRDENGIIKEANKAIEAFAALPELKKMEAKYAKGDRSKTFLNDYYIARNRSGLDCGEVLVHYFNLLTDEEIIDSVNIVRIEQITKYDAKLTERLISINEKTVSEETKKSSLINKGVGKFLGTMIGDAARNDREEDFEATMKLRDRYLTLKNNKVSVTGASMGGGNVLMPTEPMRLDYYGSKGKSEKFTTTMENYIEHLKVDFGTKKAQMAELNKGIAQEMEKAKAAGNDETVRTLKKTKGLMGIFAGMDDYYISVSLINHIDTYNKFYTGEKNGAYNDKITDWYKFLSDMHVSCKSAHYVAEKLIEMNKNEEAKAILVEALENGKESPGVESEDIQKCETMVNTL